MYYYVVLQLTISLYRFQQAHTNSCEFVKLPCVHPECGMLVKKADLPQHLETECKCRPETCGFCKKQISLNKLKVWRIVLVVVLNNMLSLTQSQYDFKYANRHLFWVNSDLSRFFSHFRKGVSMHMDTKATCTLKRTQHCWPITPNIVGCYMLRVVESCCRKFKTGQAFKAQ